MPWNAEQYAQAKALAGTLDDPQRKAALEQGIMRFEQQQANSLGGKPSEAGISGEQGAQLRSKASLQRSLNPQLAPWALGAQSTGLAALEGNEKFQQGMPEVPIETGPHLYKNEQGIYETTTKPTSGHHQVKLTPSVTQGDRYLDPNDPTSDVIGEPALPSASGNKKLYRPPELVPEHTSFAQKMGARMEFEPTVDQFRAELGDHIGPRILQLDANSPEYKEFADALWAKKYDMAERAGEPITRKKFMNTDAWQAKVASGLHGIADQAESAGLGVTEAASLGVAPELAAAGRELGGLEPGATQHLREQQARNPGSRIVGDIIGGFSPLGPAAKLTGLARGLLPVGKSALARYGLAGATAAGVGAVEGLTAAGAQKAGNVASGDASPVNAGQQALISATLAGPLGAAGHGLSEGGAWAAKRLRTWDPLSRTINLAEKAGVKTDWLRKVKPTESIEENIYRAAAEGGLPEEHAAEKVMKPMADRAAQARSGMVGIYGNKKLAYEQSPEGQEQFVPKEFTNTLERLVNESRDHLGDDIPMVKSKEFQQAYHQAYTPILTDEANARAIAQREGGWVMEVGHAHELGIRPHATIGAEEAEPVGAATVRPGAAPATQAPSPAEGLWQKASELAGGTGKRLRIADLRKASGAMDKEAFDGALKNLQKEGKLSLLRNDNPADLTHSDHAHQVDVAGNPRHLVYLEEMAPPQKMGHVPDAAPAPAVSHGAGAGEMKVVMVPKRLDAAQYDKLVRVIDDAADVGAGYRASRTRGQDHASLAAAVRKDIEQFKPNFETGAEGREGYAPNPLKPDEKVFGLSAMRGEHGRRLKGQEKLFSDAGLPKQPPSGGWEKFDPEDQKKFAAALKNSGKNPIEAQRALEQVADWKGVKKELLDIAGTRATMELKQGGDRAAAGLNSSFWRNVGGAFVPGRSIRMDPAMRALATSMDEVPKSVQTLLLKMRKGNAPTISTSDDLARMAGIPESYAKNAPIRARATDSAAGKFKNLRRERGLQQAVDRRAAAGEARDAAVTRIDGGARPRSAEPLPAQAKQQIKIEAKLNEMEANLRKPQKKAKQASVGSSLSFGLRGGGLGSRAAAVGVPTVQSRESKRHPGKMSAEDRRNLVLLIKLAQGSP